jgi:hypothetical protein
MIWVFKTSVDDHSQIRQLLPLLDELVWPGKWNFDLEDCDRILRVDTVSLDVNRLTLAFNSTGFHCEELTD